MPIETPAGTLEVENAKFRASSVEATIAVGIGTDSNDAYPLQVFKETAPSIRLSEGSTISSAARLYSNNSNLYIQTGADFSSGSSGDVAFQTMGGQSTHMVIKNDGKVGIGVTNPEGTLHVQGNRSIFGNNGGASDIIINDAPTARWAIATGGYGLRFSKHNSASDEYSTWSEKVRIDQNGNVGIGLTNPNYKLHVSGGVSYFPDGIATPGYHAQWTLNGGGNVSFISNYVKWSERVIAIPVEGTEFSGLGFIDINCPTSGTITHYKSDGTTGTATCTSSGVPISIWQALWYVVTPGQSNSSDQTKFVLTSYDNSNWRPDSNWLLIAVNNGDSGILKWVPGRYDLVNGATFYKSYGGIYKQYTSSIDGSLVGTHTTTGVKQSITINYSGFAHIHVHFLNRVNTITGSISRAIYWGLLKNSTLIVQQPFGNRWANDSYNTDEWRAISMSWSGPVLAGDVIKVNASSVEAAMTVNNSSFVVFVT